MLEVLYDTKTKQVRAWNADMSVKGNLRPKEGQEVVILPIGIPDLSDSYRVDLGDHDIKTNLGYVPPVPFNVRAEIAELKARLDNS